MLFRQVTLDGIRAGTITLAFRRWRRPTVKSGGTLRTAVGELAIDAVERTAADRITAADARRAGHPSREALLAELDRHAEGDLYRITLGALRADPRIALRESVATDGDELDVLRRRLARLDATDAWTMRTLALIRDHEGVRAGDLCGMVGKEKDRFKLDVRKLKNLGLTESLGTGYRLSPRGMAVLGGVKRP